MTSKKENDYSHKVVKDARKFYVSEYACFTSKIVIYQDKNTVSQKMCHTVRRFQRMGFLS